MGITKRSCYTHQPNFVTARKYEIVGVIVLKGTDNNAALDDSRVDSGRDPSDRLLTAIQQYWGYSSFRPLQQSAMLAAMEGRDSLTVLPTGGGKSLCYQAPAVCRDGLAIIVSPLIALMKDQVDSLTSCGIPAAFINSTLSVDERRAVAAKIRNRELKLLFAAPERLVQPRTIDFLQDCNVSFIAIDEAHCISNWGHDFRPEYRQMGVLRSAFPTASIHAFTATATEKVRDDIVIQLGLKNAEVLVGNFDRPNLFYRVERRNESMPQIRAVIDRHPKESGIVYCISRTSVEDTATALKDFGYKALAYHAGMEAEQRKAHQDAFIDEKIDIIVATVAFGMGIDKSNVRYVVHAEMPRSIEAYQQESGRAGRDGLEAECCLIYSGRDTNTWEFLINQSENADNRKSSLAALAKMEAFCGSAICRHQQLVRHFGQQLESETCGACDVCLNEFDRVQEPLVVAQKIISSVYRQEQRFGAEYTAQVLRGSKSKKVIANRHDKLSTHGLLRNEPEHVVRGWIDQLLAQGFLKRHGEHSVLAITETGAAVLKGNASVILTRPKSTTSRSSLEDKWIDVDRGLFEDLRQMRMQIATQRSVPPYVIFGDMTLRELARYRPTTMSSLTKIYGIGQQKKEEFGQLLLKRIVDYGETNNLQMNVKVAPAKPAPPPKTRKPPQISVATGRIFELFDEGLSLDEVALQTERAISTITSYLEKYVVARRIDSAQQWISAGNIHLVEETLQQLGRERLKPIYDALEQSISYEDIRVIMACLVNRELS